MRKLQPLALALSACALLLGALIVRGQDPAKVSKAHIEKLNNDQVQVLEFHSRPGDKTPMHSHRWNVVYVVQGGKERFTSADGKSQEREFKAGEVLWREPSSHSSENVGTTELIAVIVELKNAPKK